MNRHDAVMCSIEDGVLTIRVGVELIAKASKLNPEYAEFDDDADAGEEWVEPEIVDVDKFATEVLSALKSETDDGTTLVHSMIDAAVNEAIATGAEGIKMPDDIIRDRKKSK